MAGKIDLSMVKKNGYNLKNVKNQTDEICLAAVKQSPLALRYVKNQTDEICLAAVKRNGMALEFVKNQTEEICLAAVSETGSALHFVKEQNKKICAAAIKNYCHSIEFVKDQTEDLCLMAVKKDLDAIGLIRNPSRAVCLFAVNKDGRMLDNIKNQTDEICLAAIKNWWGALGYVKKQTKEMCMMAVREHYEAIDFVDNKTDDICLEAIKHDFMAFGLIKNPSEIVLANFIGGVVEDGAFSYYDYEATSSKNSTKSMYMLAIDVAKVNNIDVAKRIPEKSIDEELMLKIAKNGHGQKVRMPEHLCNLPFIKKVTNKNKYEINVDFYFNEKSITKNNWELGLFLIKNDYDKFEDAVKYFRAPVPKKIIDFAFKQNPKAISLFSIFYEEYEDEINRTKALSAVKRDGLTLKLLPKRVIDDEITMLAIKNNYKALKFVSKQSDDLCLEAYNINKNSVIFFNKNHSFVTDTDVINAIMDNPDYLSKVITKITNLNNKLAFEILCGDRSTDFLKECLKTKGNSAVIVDAISHLKNDELLVFYEKNNWIFSEKFAKNNEAMNNYKTKVLMLNTMNYGKIKNNNKKNKII